MSFGLKTKISLLFLVFLITTLCLIRFFNIPKFTTLFFPKKKEGVVIIRYFPFSTKDSLKEWKEKVFHKRVDYKIESKNGESYVRAVSSRSCSAMYYKLQLDINTHPILSWKWRVHSFPYKSFADNPISRKEDDFAGRVYVIFQTLFFSNSKVLEYIWAKDLESGTISSSPYSKNIKLIVVESGLKQRDEWVLEERDICKDYELAFGTRPNLDIGAIAFMCDSDSTESSAEAYFDEIKIFYKK